MAECTQSLGLVLPSSGDILKHSLILAVFMNSAKIFLHISGHFNGILYFHYACVNCNQSSNLNTVSFTLPKIRKI
jgi:hypothetical protein